MKHLIETDLIAILLLAPIAMAFLNLIREKTTAKTNFVGLAAYLLIMFLVGTAAKADELQRGDLSQAVAEALAEKAALEQTMKLAKAAPQETKSILVSDSDNQ